MAKIGKIQEVETALLVPYARNAKRHGLDQVEKIANSIQEFGFLSPCLIDKEKNIIAGHGRVLAAQKLGLEKVPCLYIEGLTDEQRRAYILADNRLTELGDWDFDLVFDELEQLKNLDFDISVTGFELPETEFEITEDEPLEAEDKTEPKTKLGDIWQLGKHRLMCGDSSSFHDVETLMGGVLADLVFTDPPYGVAIGEKNRTLNAANGAHAIEEDIINDDLAERELYDLLVECFSNLRLHCKDDCAYYVTSPQGGSLGLMMMMMMMRDAGLTVRHVLMWEKNAATFSMGRLDYDYQHEPIFYTWTKKHNFYASEHQTTVWKYDKPHKSELHPTMKPVALVANAIRNSSREGDVVADIFGGSGTTLIACEELNRRCYMIELSPHYCDVIIKRWETLTGKEAILLNNSEG